MWVELVIDSLVRPRLAARKVLGLGLSPALLVQAAVVTACLGMVFIYLALRLSPVEADAVSRTLVEQPLVGAALQLAMTAAAVALTARIGRLFGGSGTLYGALAVVVWLNVMMVLLQALQLVALAVAPQPLVFVVAVATPLWALWAFSNFVAELHGFGNALIVLAGTLLTLMVLLFGFAMLLAILGVTPRAAG